MREQGLNLQTSAHTLTELQCSVICHPPTLFPCQVVTEIGSSHRSPSDQYENELQAITIAALRAPLLCLLRISGDSRGILEVFCPVTLELPVLIPVSSRTWEGLGGHSVPLGALS